MENQIELGIVRISGQDAKKFLQGLVTCDVNQISPQQGSLAALCDPKGRVLVNFILLEFQETLLLLMPPSMSALFLKLSKRYAQFSRVTIEDVSASWCCYANITALKETLFRVITTDTNLEITHPAGQLTITQQSPQATTHEINWTLACIKAGVVSILPTTSGLFTPHMLNLDKFNALSFNKGCYVGQEIIARTEHLGKLKRHLHLISLISAEIPASGAAITLPDATTVGNIINAAAEKDNVLALAVVEDRALTDQMLTVGKNPIAFL